MSTVAQVRTQHLRHHLDEATAATPYDTRWLITRVHEYATAAGITVDVVLDALSYYRRTGVQVGQW